MTRTLTALTLLALLPACDLFRQDNPDIDGDALDGGGCEEQVTVLAGVDAMSALGFSAADVLSVAEGQHEGPMLWGAGIADGPVQVAFGPEAGAGKLTVAVAYQGGEVRHITSTPKQGDYEGDGGALALCNDRLEVDVAVTVDSEGGAFAESFDAPLRATTRGIGKIAHELALADIQGSFAVTKLEPANAKVAPIALDIGISGAGLFGGASSFVEVSEGDTASAGALTIARWPAEDSVCAEYGEAPVGLGDLVAKFSADDALALVAQAPNLALTWQGAPAAAMTLALAPEAYACTPIESGELGTLRIPAKATVTTADGRWNGTFAVELTARPGPDGTLAGVDLFIQSAYANSVPAADFEASFGLKDVDFTGYQEGSLDFSGQFVPAGDAATATGQVTVLGVKLHMCSDVPGEACEGNTFDELEMGTWKSE